MQTESDAAADRRQLAELAERAMQERGLATSLAPEAQAQLDAIDGPGRDASPDIADLSHLPWCSIDDDSRDLDQLSVAVPSPPDAPADERRVLVAIADVDVLVPKDSPLDRHAQRNTTSVYTSARIFPMLPERLSTNLTSLNEGVARLAMVAQLRLGAADGALRGGRWLRARVRNHARLAYDAVAAWLDGRGALPAAAAAVPGADAQLRLQDELAQRMLERRRAAGALEFQGFRPRAVFDGDKVVAIEQDVPNRARQLIAELMIATNTVTASFLAGQGIAGIRRVVRSPDRWVKLVELAAEHGTTLPAEPDGPALAAFLSAQRARDPMRFADLSLVVVKLMGAGEYVVELPGAPATGHFGLGIRDYAHATAPNRRYPDLVTARLLKAAIAGRPSPYPTDELVALARHCTLQEDNANRVERQVRKSEIALLLRGRIGDAFDAVVTGANGLANTWLRTLDPPAEGKLRTPQPLRIGDVVQVTLKDVDIPRGHIDFDFVALRGRLA